MTEVADLTRTRDAGRRLIALAVRGLSFDAAWSVVTQEFPEIERLRWNVGTTRAAALRLIEQHKAN